MTTTTDNEASIIDGAPATIPLSTGLEVEIQRLKMRQLMRAARIITHGAGDAITALNLDSVDDFAESILPVILLAIPDAEQEAIDFIISMVQPVGFQQNPRTDADRKRNAALYSPMIDVLANPEIDDVFTIFEKVFEQERPYLESLGKRLSALVSMETKVAERKSTTRAKKA